MQHGYAAYQTPANIALVKYWGKRDAALNVPLNSSLSITLDNQFSTTTTVTIKPEAGDEFVFQDKPSAISEKMRRLILFFKDDSVGICIDSQNSFPTGAGLASSASGYACLALCLRKLFRPDMSDEDLSVLTRMASGSACRSIHGGFVEWVADCTRGEQHTDSESGTRKGKLLPSDLCPSSYARRLGHDWPELCAFVCIFSAEKKLVPSTAGMIRSTETSSQLHRRVAEIDAKIGALKSAICRRDFHAFSEIVMRDSNQFHACCLDTFPPLMYLSDESKRLIELVHEMNLARRRNMAAYTFDAGANGVIFCLQEDADAVQEMLAKHWEPLRDAQSGLGFLKCTTGVVPVGIL